jgi:hypothetical protein
MKVSRSEEAVRMQYSASNAGDALVGLDRRALVDDDLEGLSSTQWYWIEFSWGLLPNVGLRCNSAIQEQALSPTLTGEPNRLLSTARYRP